jgi:hypothetical protein
MNMTRHVHLLVVDPNSMYSHGYIRAESKTRHILAPRMSEADSNDRNLLIFNTFMIRPGINIYILHLLWLLKCGSTLHFLAICALFGIKCKSTRVFKNTNSEYHTRDQHQTNHGNAWPAWQIMASAASSGIVHPSQTPVCHSLKHLLFSAYRLI